MLESTYHINLSNTAQAKELWQMLAQIGIDVGNLL